MATCKAATHHQMDRGLFFENIFAGLFNNKGAKLQTTTTSIVN